MASCLFVRNDHPCSAEVAAALVYRSNWDTVDVGIWRPDFSSRSPYRIVVAPLASIAPVLREASVPSHVLPYGSADRMEHAFLLAAKDYLCVPFSRSEVVARSRRLTHVDEAGFGHVVVRAGITLVLTGPQRLLLELFCRFPGYVIDRGTIVEHLGVGNPGSVDSRAPDMAVSRLRRALRDTDVTIETVRRRGYRLVAKPEERARSERV